jgi:TonB family protein
MRPLQAGEVVEFRIEPPLPDGVRAGWSASRRNVSARVAAHYTAPYIVEAGASPVTITATLYGPDRSEPTTSIQIHLLPGAVAGAEECLGPGQSFSPVAGVFPDYVYVGELPEAIHRVDAEIPRSPSARGVEQVIVVRAFVCRTGKVIDAYAPEVIRNPPEPNDPKLTAAALAAVRRWEFKPARLQGEAVAVVVDVPIRFTK